MNDNNNYKEGYEVLTYVQLFIVNLLRIKVFIVFDPIYANSWWKLLLYNNSVYKPYKYKITANEDPYIV